MKQKGNCCTGTALGSPAATGNRPGLNAIRYRVGTYTSFFATMRARLSSNKFPELAALKTRAADDPAIALLDAWAVSADVLSFYQERLANEAYLATATERRSVIELARLIGFQPRPGVSASVFLAYELDASAQELEIPVHLRAQSVPGPGEQMQTFETAEPIKARAEWNTLKLRMTQPPRRDETTILQQRLYFHGTATLLKANDVLLVDFGGKGRVNELRPYRISIVRVDAAVNRTQVKLSPFSSKSGAPEGAAVAQNRSPEFKSLIGKLIAPASIPPRNELRLARNVKTTFAQGGEIFPQLLQASLPRLAGSLYGALANTKITEPVPIKVYAMRVKAPLFANNAPNPFVTDISGQGANTTVATKPLALEFAWRVNENAVKSGLTVLSLDAPYEQIKTDEGSNSAAGEGASYTLVDWPELKFQGERVVGGHNLPGEILTEGRLASIHKVIQVNTMTMSAGMSFTAKVTQLALDKGWLADSGEFGELLKSELLLRGTQIHAQSELLQLADDPIEQDICDHFRERPLSTHEIELDGLYDGLKPGRWLIISGQRTDVPGTTGTQGAERVMLAGVRHGIKQFGGEKGSPLLDGDKTHTFITLAKPLAYCYKRDSVLIYANVVKADHGETRRETLGGGDGRQALQSFSLKQPPLTFVAASSPAGVSSTLEVRVNGVRWREVDALLNLAPGAQGFITRRDDDEKTSVLFGDGKQGARLPTGQENILAIYRNGIGRAGNVRAMQISLVTDKPLGVKAVSNPLRASGGADRDTRDQARRNAPLAVMALDRLVSVPDYADFARTFAGIGKAVATRLTHGRRQFIHVTIAGVDDAPIDLDSDLYQNLIDAYRRNGDPHLPVHVQIRTLRPLVIHAKVGVASEYPWETVAPQIRAVLFDTFGFEYRELGQDVFKSTVIAAIQNVRGVRYSLVEIAVLTEDQIIDSLQPQVESSPEKVGAEAVRPPNIFGLGDKVNSLRADQNIPIALASAVGQIRPAELAYLLPTVPEALLLELQA